MTVVLFVGPTLPAAEIRRRLQAEIRPPVRRGDVLQAMALEPEAIGIIDGYFHDVPSVWHKEILWALDQGVPVLGAASMGALRAAELADFGMVGVGAIYEAYRAGRLEADDAVAVQHGPPELGYPALSEALVNILWTLDAAGAQAIIDAETAARLAAIAQTTFYPERTFGKLLGDGRAAGLPADELDALEAWLPGGRVKQKRSDALALIDMLAAGPPPGPPRGRFVFERTEMWENLRASVAAA